MSRSEQIRLRLLECLNKKEIITDDLIKVFSQLMFEGKLSNNQLLELFNEIRDYLNLQTIESYRKNQINPKTNRPFSYNWMKTKDVLQTEIQGKKYYVDNE
jgi:hypothetical protein